MSEGCEVLAHVTVETLAAFGENPGLGMYVCAYGAQAVPVAAAPICGTATAATAVGRWAATPGGREVMEAAASTGCTVVVQAADDVVGFVVVKGKEIKADIKNSLREAERTYRAINTAEGIKWLIGYLTHR